MLRLLLACLLTLPLFATTPKDTLVIGVENETARINPLFDEDHDSALDFVFSGLIRFSPDMQIQPDLATSWEKSADGLNWVFHLRKGFLWHDGKPFSAQDVKFTLEQAQNPKLNAPARANFSEIKSVQVLDPYTLKITLKAPFPPLRYLKYRHFAQASIGGQRFKHRQI
ncbi:hypothetical protein ASB1_13510 [Helicobacter heilmannii]|nr:hypothetical protein ASB1_13510 [Helicobacter heilmannii]